MTARAYDSASTAALRELSAMNVEAAKAILAEREEQDARETLVPPAVIDCEPVPGPPVMPPNVILRVLPMLVGLPLSTLADLARGSDEVAVVAQLVIADRLASAWRRVA